MAVTTSVVDPATGPAERGPSARGGVLSSLAYLALLIGGLVVSVALAKGAYPTPTASPEEILRWRQDNASAVRIAGVALGLSGLALIWYAAWLGAVLRRQASLLTFAGGLISGGFLLLSGLLHWVVQRPETLAQVPVMRTLHQLIFVTAGPGFVTGLALLTGASSIALIRARLVPTWLGVTGVAAGALSLVAQLALIPEGEELFGIVPVGRFLTMLWMVAVAVAVGRRLAARSR
jgi:Domain of unknown function (DUF4386)